MRTALHIHDADDPARIDIFHLYFDDEGRCASRSASPARPTITRGRWKGHEEIDFAGGTGAWCPANAEQVVEHIYGAGWRTPEARLRLEPRPHAGAASGVVPGETSRRSTGRTSTPAPNYDTGSTFFERSTPGPTSPRTVHRHRLRRRPRLLRLRRGRPTVVGLDRSEVGVRHATKKAHDSASATTSALPGRATCPAMPSAARRPARRSARPTAGRCCSTSASSCTRSPRTCRTTLMTPIHELARPGDILRRGVPHRQGREERPRCTASTTAASRTRPSSRPGSWPSTASPARRRGGHRALAVQGGGPGAVPGRRPALRRP